MELDMAPGSSTEPVHSRSFWGWLTGMPPRLLGNSSFSSNVWPAGWMQERFWLEMRKPLSACTMKQLQIHHG